MKIQDCSRMQNNFEGLFILGILRMLRFIRSQPSTLILTIVTTRLSDLGITESFTRSVFVPTIQLCKSKIFLWIGIKVNYEINFFLLDGQLLQKVLSTTRIHVQDSWSWRVYWRRQRPWSVLVVGMKTSSTFRVFVQVVIHKLGAYQRFES